MKIRNEIKNEITARLYSNEIQAFSKYATLSSAAIRAKTLKNDIRLPFAQDADRILHSKSYPKYCGRMQVFPLTGIYGISTRGLHVQFVLQVAISIGRALGLNEDLIRAISLGHDIGHTPFSHDGEKVLNLICKCMDAPDIKTFKHQAQSVRVYKELEDNGRGLNLTLQVLDGILYHNAKMKKGILIPNRNKTLQDFEVAYQNEFMQPEDSEDRPMTLEGCVVRVADFIAYIGRDIQDALILKIIGRDQLPREAMEVLGYRNNDIIDTLISDVINCSYDSDKIAFSPEVFNALDDLKEFSQNNLYSYAARTETFSTLESQLPKLLNKYISDIESYRLDSNIHNLFLKDMDPAYIKNTSPQRKAIDFFVGMLDEELLEEFDALKQNYEVEID